MEYILQFNEATNRQVIDTRINTGFVAETSVMSDCWIAEKKALGFELTDMQKNMMEARNAC